MSIWIRRAEIVSFGKLKNCVFEGGEGIRILEAPNESGKSTLAAFLKYCLYGFAGSRNQSVADNEKKLYTPWESASAEGTVWVRKGENEYRISRKTLGNKETVSATDAATGKPAFGDEIPGVALFGISEEVFSRTLFLRQSDLPQSRDPVLADQLQNIAVSPEEQVGSRKAMERLAKAKNELRARAMGGGILPKLEKEEADLRERLNRALKAGEELAAARADLKKQQDILEANRVRREEVSAELANLDRWDAKNETGRLLELASQMKDAEREHAVAAELIASRGEEDSPFLTGLMRKNSELERLRLSRLETEKELEKLTGELEALSGGISPEDAAKAETKRKELRIGRISLAAAAAVFLALGIVFIRISTVAGICLFAASALCLAGVGVCFLFGDRLAKSLGASGEKDLKKRLEAVPEEQKRREETLRSLNAVRTEIAGRQEMEDALGAEIQNGIRSYRMELGTDFPTQLQLLIDACQNVARLDTRRKETKAAYEAALGGRNLHELEKAAEGALEPQRSRELAEREDRFLAQQRDMLASQEKDKIARLSSLQAKAEDPAVLTGKLEAVRAAIADGNVKYAAYEAARKGIEEASDLMKARIAPQVGERAGLYFQAATGGAYRTLEMDTALSMTTGAGGVSHDADYLSAGTKDLAALSKRLALIDVLFDGMGVPIVLDDAFGRLDDGRLTATARMLGEAASHHQILILACCDRERKAFERAGVPFALSLGVGNGGETPEER